MTSQTRRSSFSRSVPARLVVLLIIVFHAPAHAQTGGSSPGASVGFSLQQLVPRGEFRENTRDAPWSHQGALAFDLVLPVNSFVFVRLDYFFGMYDKNRVKTYDKALCGGYCDSGSFRAGGIGSGLILPRGPLRPYATAGLGRMSIRPFEDESGEKTDTGAGYWIYGAGVRIPTRSKWSIDVSWRHHRTGPISYQHAEQNGFGSIAVVATRNRIQFDMFTAGLQYGFGGS